MPLKLISSGGGSVIIEPESTGSTSTLKIQVPPANAVLMSNNHTGPVNITGSISAGSGLFQTTTANSCVYIQSLPANNGNRIDSYNFPITAARPLAINSANTKFWINDTEMMNIDSSGRVNLYGGSGGSQLRLRNGGDLTIYSAGETYGCTIWNDPPDAGMDGAGQYLWTERLNLYSQRCGYDRLWDNYPSISVRNDTTVGGQGEFRIHGINGVSGGDFSVYLRVDGGGNASDGRRKAEVETITNALDTVLQLRGVRYVGINSEFQPQTEMSMANGRRFGFIAQECIPIVPEIVKDSGNNNPKPNGWADQYAVDYGSLVALLTEAIRDLNNKIETMQSEIETLKKGS